MHRNIVIAVAFAAIISLPLAAPAWGAGETATHIGHVADKWMDTPDGMGLLPTAEAEAAVALRHADFALADAGNLAAIKAHTAHVLHAVDPALAAGGPGLGYGLTRAAAGVIAHVSLAAGAPDASDAAKAHAGHVAASVDNIVSWGKHIAALGERISGATSAEDAARAAAGIRDLVGYIVNGTDANGDGKVSWGEGEGGLVQARQHLNFMKGAIGAE